MKVIICCGVSIMRSATATENSGDRVHSTAAAADKHKSDFVCFVMFDFSLLCFCFCFLLFFLSKKNFFFRKRKKTSFLI